MWHGHDTLWLRVNTAWHVEPGGLVPSETKVELMPTIAPLAIISLELPANSSGVAWKHASALNYCGTTCYVLLATCFLLRLYDYILTMPPGSTPR